MVVGWTREREDGRRGGGGATAGEQGGGGRGGRGEFCGESRE